MNENDRLLNSNNKISEHKGCPSKSLRIEHNHDKSFKEFDIACLEHDPELRPQIWKNPINQCDEIRWAYLRARPYQPRLPNYPLSEKQHPRFQASWFTQFFSWLEYSPSKDAAFCLSCYLFNIKLSGRPGWDVFIAKDFKN